MRHTPPVGRISGSTKTTARSIAATATLALMVLLATTAGISAQTKTSDTVTVRAKGTPAAGAWPKMAVYVNGQPASTVTVNNSDYKDFTFNSNNWTSSSTIEIVFTNDAYIAPEDRNLIIESITVPNGTIYPQDDGVTYDRGYSLATVRDGQDVIKGQPTMWWGGALKFTNVTYGGTNPPTTITAVPPADSDDQIVVRAFGTFAEGAWPQMLVRVDGVTVHPGLVTVSNIGLEDFTFTPTNLTDSSLVDVVFVNDGYEDPGTGPNDIKDRNLYVDSIFVNDIRIQSRSHRVHLDWGYGSAAFDGHNTGEGVYALYYSGALRYDTTGLAAPPTFNEKPPLETEVVYEHDFSDGTIGEIWNLYDTGGNAGWGLRRPSAFSVQDMAGAVGGKAMTITASMGTGTEKGLLVSGGAIMNYAQTYGRYSMRVRLEPDPDRVTTGVALLWPASNVWPGDGEIDWFETWRDRYNRRPVDLVTHFMENGSHEAIEVYQHLSDGSLADGTRWHTYELDWRPDYLAVKVDDGPANIITTDPARIPDWDMRMTAQLDTWDAPDNKTSQPTISRPVSMYVDWVKVESYPELTEQGRSNWQGSYWDHTISPPSS